MRHANHVQGYQSPAFGNSKVQIDDITHLWPSVDLAAEVQTRHLSNFKDREYSCADFCPHVDANELCEQLATLTDDLRAIIGGRHRAHGSRVELSVWRQI